MVLLQETEIPPVCPASKLTIIAELTSPKYFECNGVRFCLNLWGETIAI